MLVIEDGHSSHMSMENRFFLLNPGEVTDRYMAPAKVYEEASVPDNLDGTSVDQSNKYN